MSRTDLKKVKNIKSKLFQRALTMADPRTSRRQSGGLSPVILPRQNTAREVTGEVEIALPNGGADSFSDIEDLRRLISACSNQNEELLKKIESLDASKDKELRSLRGSIARRSQIDNTERENERGREYLLPRDTYSFFSSVDYFTTGTIPRPRLSFICAMGVMLVQVSTMVLLAVDVIDMQTPGNPLGVPPGVDSPVRITQMLALLITVVSQDEVRLSLNVLANGYDTNMLRAVYDGACRTKWYFSLISRFLVGCLGLAVTFMLIVRADTVRDLLLNFTAVEFVFHLDNGLFALAKWGYIGEQVQEEAEYIALAELPSRSTPDVRQVRRSRILRAFFFVLILATLLGFWLWIAISQKDGAYLSQTIYVQFGDEFSPDLGTFSGLYELSTSRGSLDGRVEYFARYPGIFDKSSKFGYCKKENAWTFSYGEDALIVPDACDYRAKSPVSYSFEVTSTAALQWSLMDAATTRLLPLQRFLLTITEDFTGKECNADTDCKFSCKSKKCVCNGERYGLNCEFLKPCETLEIDEEFAIFADSRPRSTSYNILRDPSTNVIVQAYNRPVFVSGKTEWGFNDLIFFTGRRWVLTNTDRFDDFETGLELDDNDIASFMATGFHAHFSNYTVLFVSEPVDVDTPIDSATPIDLHWFHAEATSGTEPGMQRADRNRLSGAFLICAVCDTITNPCRFGNSCVDGACVCTTGSSGILCQSKPMGNGRCDPFFNNAEFEYDGGDCCQTTCISTEEHFCGMLGDSGLSTREYVGYSHCKDPAQLCPPTVDSCWNQLDLLSGPSEVAVSRNGAVIAAAHADHVVQVFEQGGSQWVPRDLLMDTSGLNYIVGRSGSVALSDDGSVVAVGLPSDGNVDPTAIVRVFRWVALSRTYKQLGSDIYLEAVNFGTSSGASVAFSGDGSTLAIGAPQSGTSVSVAYVVVYEYDVFTSSWTQLGQRIEGRDGDGDDDFGKSISLSSDGRIFAAGAPIPGYVRVYKYSHPMTNWTQIGHFDEGDDGCSLGEYSGDSVSLSSDGVILAFGAPRATIAYVEVWEYNNVTGDWTDNGKLFENNDDNYYFGQTLSLSSNGRFLAVANAGSVRTYTYDKMVGWTRLGQILDGGAALGFGYSLSLSGDAKMLAVSSTNYRQETNVGIYRLATSEDLSIKDPEDSATPPESAVAISVVIRLDSVSEQTGLSLWCGGVSYALVPIGSFEKENQLRNDTFFVQKGTDCEFTVTDGFGDGLCCAYGEGYYEIYYGEDMSNRDNLLAIGGRLFGFQEKVTFTVSPPTTLVPITILFRTGQYGGEDTDLFLSCTGVLETQLLTESAFRASKIHSDTFLLPEGTECLFTVTDLQGDGGSYSIYYGEDTTNPRNIIAWSTSESIGDGAEVPFSASPPPT